ncbi:accessory gland protein Acp32CD [Drosophila obscura]|uniref:accessory gland protein Acp32CD n=1 Tax=Drosophila obscura TaxID=7282 RepID=UPI000B9FCF44|nr:accessory gland protein Acp32CD [Drosophila obscura]
MWRIRLLTLVLLTLVQLQGRGSVLGQKYYMNFAFNNNNPDGALSGEGIGGGAEKQAPQNFGDHGTGDEGDHDNDNLSYHNDNNADGDDNNGDHNEEAQGDHGGDHDGDGGDGGDGDDGGDGGGDYGGDDGGHDGADGGGDHGGDGDGDGDGGDGNHDGGDDMGVPGDVGDDDDSDSKDEGDRRKRMAEMNANEGAAKAAGEHSHHSSYEISIDDSFGGRYIRSIYESSESHGHSGSKGGSGSGGVGKDSSASQGGEDTLVNGHPPVGPLGVKKRTYGESDYEEYNGDN